MHGILRQIKTIQPGYSNPTYHHVDLDRNRSHCVCNNVLRNGSIWSAHIEHLGTNHQQQAGLVYNGVAVLPHHVVLLSFWNPEFQFLCLDIICMLVAALFQSHFPLSFAYKTNGEAHALDDRSKCYLF